jgi:hypothetical protein
MSERRGATLTTRPRHVSPVFRTARHRARVVVVELECELELELELVRQGAARRRDVVPRVGLPHDKVE